MRASFSSTSSVSVYSLPHATFGKQKASVNNSASPAKDNGLNRLAAGFKRTSGSFGQRLKNFFTFSNATDALGNRWANLRAKANYSLEAMRDAVDFFFFDPPKTQSNERLKRSPIQLAHMITPNNAFRFYSLKSVFSGINIGTQPYVNKKPSTQPAGVLWLDGRGEALKQSWINDIADLAFDAKQVKQVDFAKLTKADDMTQALKDALKGEGTRLIVLNNLFGGTADEKEKLAFAKAFENLLLSTGYEESMKAAGLDLSDAMLLINTAELVNGNSKPVKKEGAPAGTVKASPELFHLKDRLLMNRGRLQDLRFNRIIDLNQDERGFSLERAIGAIGSIRGAA